MNVTKAIEILVNLRDEILEESERNPTHSGHPRRIRALDIAMEALNLQENNLNIMFELQERINELESENNILRAKK